MTVHFKKTAIIGVGLIGGSLAMNIRSKGLSDVISGIGRGVQNLELAKRTGVVDTITLDLAEGVKGADLVVVAVPVQQIAPAIMKALPYLKPPAIITDVGSVKKAVIDAVEPRLPKGIHFVPGHPIAGTENSGVEAAFRNLFVGKVSILTPTQKTAKDALNIVKALWEEAGAKVVAMDAVEHDRILAAISHLPHMVAYSLVNAIADAGAKTIDLLKYSGGGFRDLTRIASSSPEMWTDICALNKVNIVDTLDRFQRRLDVLKRQIAGDDFKALKADFERAKGVRDSLPVVKKFTPK